MSKWKRVATNDISFGDTETKEDKIERLNRLDKATRVMPLIKEIKKERQPLRNT